MAPCIVVASNSEAVLRSNLLTSPDLVGLEISVQRGAASAGQAYNRGMDETKAEILVFAHQDMFLPAGWLSKFQRSLALLEQEDPNWGVLGMFGITPAGTIHGHVYSTGIGRVLGADFEGAREVQSLDEIVLVLRRASGLRFDERLPGFHLYGTDICLVAKSQGLRSYTFAAFGIHNSNGIPLLPAAYWRCYFYLQKKWFRYLPIMTPCIVITRWNVPALHNLLHSILVKLVGRNRSGSRVTDPATVLVQYEQNRLT